MWSGMQEPKGSSCPTSMPTSVRPHQRWGMKDASHSWINSLGVPGKPAESRRCRIAKHDPALTWWMLCKGSLKAFQAPAG